MIPSQDSDALLPIPFYSAGEQNSLERGVRPYTIVEILRGVFQEDFEKAIQCYMDGCPEGVAAAIGERGASNFRLRWLSEPKTESTLRQPLCTMAVDLVFRAKVTATVPKSGCVPVEVRDFEMKFRMRYLLKLWSKQCSAPIIAPDSLFPADPIKEQKTAVTNQYLLPVMYTEDYSGAGQRMLARYYPEALERPTAVDGWELARRMHLNARRIHLAQGSDIQGRIYFDWSWILVEGEDGQTVREKIEPMTILINTELCPTPEIENSTLIHECCHVYLDLPFFKLQMLSGKPYTCYTSRKKKRGKFSRSNTTIDWMELQAEKLPAYVLMEEENTRKEIERLLAQRGGRRSPENMAWIARQLAGTFKVSRSMAKYRMIELGYPEAEGIMAYIDNVRIPDYGSSGTWEPGITYAISLPDAGAVLRESRQFANALREGCYTYVEGHFCLDIETYVIRDCSQQKRLTAYARYHIEECCIAFTVRGRYANAKYEDAQAARKKEAKDKYQSRHGFESEPETKARAKENALFVQDSQIWMKLKTNMPDSVGEAVQFILDEKGITQQELAMRLGTSRAALRKWCVGCMSKRHIVAICIALDVRQDIGQELIRLAGYTLLNNKEDNLLLAMLFETKDMTVARANEIMRQEKLNPLTEGQDEELAV